MYAGSPRAICVGGCHCGNSECGNRPCSLFLYGPTAASWTSTRALGLKPDSTKYIYIYIYREREREGALPTRSRSSRGRPSWPCGSSDDEPAGHVCFVCLCKSNDFIFDIFIYVCMFYICLIYLYVLYVIVYLIYVYMFDLVMFVYFIYACLFVCSNDLFVCLLPAIAG